MNEYKIKIRKMFLSDINLSYDYADNEFISIVRFTCDEDFAEVFDHNNAIAIIEKLNKVLDIDCYLVNVGDSNDPN